MRFNIFILFILAQSSAFSQLNSDTTLLYNLVDINGIKYLQKEKNKPFNGIAISEFNGRIEKSLSYIHGKLNGFVNQWNFEGTLVESCEYLNGEANGRYYFFQKNDSIKIEGHFKDGYKEGCWKYFKGGVLQKEVEYEKDKIIGAKQ